MAFNTGNPIGSTDPRDLSDNAANFDKALGTTAATWVDRFGVRRDSFEGRLAKGSFYRAGTFAAGYTLTNMRQTLEYGGHEYSWSGAFPKVVAAGATPTSSGGIGAGAWIDRTDDSLRDEIRETVFQTTKRSYAEAGFNLVDGSFEAGGTLVNVNDVLLQERTGKAFSGPAGTVAAGTNPASGGFVDKSGGLLRHELATSASSISFVFDDAYQSVKTVLKPLFDSYNAKFGIAVPVGSLGNPNRLTLEGVREFAELGYEVINHAASGDLMNTNKGLGGVLGEIATCWSTLANIGIKTTGFQTPSSSLDPSYYDAVSQYSDYAFTISNRQELLPYNTPSNKLFRFSIESATQQECVDVLSTLKNNNGGIVFYAHDIVSGDANYLKIQATLDAAALSDIPVLLPRACIERSVVSLGNRVKMFLDEKIIDNSVADYRTSGNGETYAIGAATQDITITIPNAGTFLLQKTVNLTDLDDIGDVVNYSSTIRDLSGGIVTNCAVAMKFYDAVDGGGNMILATTEDAINLNNVDVRYYTEAIKGAAKSVLVYIRLVCSAAGSVLVRQPVLRYGTSVAPRKFIPNQITIHSMVIPTQTITFGSGFQNVLLTDKVSNGLFAIASNTITFQKNATVQVSFSPVASGAGVGTGWTGGSCAMTVGGSSIIGISPIAGGVDWLSGQSVLTFKVPRGTSVVLKVLANSINFALSSSNSRLVIIEI